MEREVKIIIAVSEKEKQLFQKAAEKTPSDMGGAVTLSAFIRAAAHKLAAEVLSVKA